MIQRSLFDTEPPAPKPTRKPFDLDEWVAGELSDKEREVLLRTWERQEREAAMEQQGEDGASRRLLPRHRRRQ